MKSPLVSVIVPIYNGESFLERALNSLSNQSYKNIEVLMINDGSEDNSLKIMKKFQEKDKRFKSINKHNTGVSDSRNIGINKAHGEYLMFLDADDWLSDDAIEICVSAIDSNDAVHFSAQYASDNELLNLYPCLYNTYSDCVLSNDEVFIHLISYKIAGHCWCYLYKTSVLKENDVKFDLELFYCEDFLFVLNFLTVANDIKIINKPLYKYYRNDVSVTRSIEGKIRNLKTIPNLREKVINVFPDDKKDKYIDLYNQTLLSLFLDYYSSFANDYSKKKFKNIVNEINESVLDFFKLLDIDKFSAKWKIFILSIIHKKLNFLYLYLTLYNKLLK